MLMIRHLFERRTVVMVGSWHFGFEKKNVSAICIFFLFSWCNKINKAINLLYVLQLLVLMTFCPDDDVVEIFQITGFKSDTT